MAKLFWKRHPDHVNDADVEHGIGKDSEVNEQHPLPVQLIWKQEGIDEYEEVDEAHAIPVRLFGSTPSYFVTPTQEIAGVSGTLYTAGDAFGNKFKLTVPQKGEIRWLVFIDKDDEGLQMILILFDQDFTETADNAAFAVSDADMQNCIGMINLPATSLGTTQVQTGYMDVGSNRVGQVQTTIQYSTPNGTLWGQWLTGGGPTIALSSIPVWRMGIMTGS